MSLHKRQNARRTEMMWMAMNSLFRTRTLASRAELELEVMDLPLIHSEATPSPGLVPLAVFELARPGPGTKSVYVSSRRYRDARTASRQGGNSVDSLAQRCVKGMLPTRSEGNCDFVYCQLRCQCGRSSRRRVQFRF